MTLNAAAIDFEGDLSRNTAPAVPSYTSFSSTGEWSGV